jgi:hypothetical protein
MMNEAYLPYVVTEIFCMILAAMSCFWMQKYSELEPEDISLRHMMISYIIMVGTDAGSVFVENSIFSRMHVLNAILSALSISAVTMGCFFWLQFVEERLNDKEDKNEKKKGIKKEVKKKIQKIIWGLTIGMCVLNLLSIATGWIFYIRPDGQYKEGPLFWMQDLLTMLLLFLATGHAMYKALQKDTDKKRRECISYILYIAIGIISVLLGDRWRMIPIFELCILLAVQNLFFVIYKERETRMIQQKQELMESRTAIMLSQIQPHFLYNTLTVIQEMCVDKAPEAAETTVLFSNFLRGNLSSLTRNEPISFEKELMHTRTYLELEQRRFLERLQVIYDIQTMDFSIPPLTLQPIAENAVKHGISERTDGGKVWISSFEEETEYVVEVRDNGVGFDIEAAPDTSRDHIGMENVKSRLNLLCHGRMTVESIKGQGTKVQIRIPKIKL